MYKYIANKNTRNELTVSMQGKLTMKQQLILSVISNCNSHF